MTMFPPRAVVVGVDGTHATEGALNVAETWGERFGTRIDLVHAVDVSGVPAEQLDTFVAADGKRVRVALEARLSGARLAYLEEPHGLLSLPGHPAEVLLERARHDPADLVVLGEHRRRGVLDIGSTARAVLAHASCPVWAQAGPARVVRRVLVPVDFSAESVAALELAGEVARAYEAELEAVHVMRAPDFAVGPDGEVPGPTYVVDALVEEARVELDALVASHPTPGVSSSTTLVVGSPAHEIVERVQAGADLVVMGTHGRTGLAALLLGSVASAVLRQSPVPVLVTRGPDREWRLP